MNPFPLAPYPLAPSPRPVVRCRRTPLTPPRPTLRSPSHPEELGPLPRNGFDSTIGQLESAIHPRQPPRENIFIWGWQHTGGKWQMGTANDVNASHLFSPVTSHSLPRLGLCCISGPKTGWRRADEFLQGKRVERSEGDEPETAGASLRQSWGKRGWEQQG